MILPDTSGLFCLHYAKEPRHDESRDLFESSGPKLVHSYVLAEFVALSGARGASRGAALAFLNALIGQPDVEVVWVDESLHRQGMTFLASRLGRGYSLTDAISFVVMTERGLTEALTTDRHVEQAGFVRPLAPRP